MNVQLQLSGHRRCNTGFDAIATVSGFDGVQVIELCFTLVQPSTGQFTLCCGTLSGGGRTCCTTAARASGGVVTCGLRVDCGADCDGADSVVVEICVEAKIQATGETASDCVRESFPC